MISTLFIRGTRRLAELFCEDVDFELLKHETNPGNFERSFRDVRDQLWLIKSAAMVTFVN